MQTFETATELVIQSYRMWMLIRSGMNETGERHPLQSHLDEMVSATILNAQQILGT